MAKTAQASDVRNNLPQGMNHVDMDSRGDRNGAMTDYGYYGGENQNSVLDRIFAVWGVTDAYLINPAFNEVMPKISTDGGPCFMLKFGDGKWRYASFHGLNGPPWYRCSYEPAYEAPTGAIANFKRRIEQKTQHVESVKAHLQQLEQELAELVVTMRRAETDHKQKSEPNVKRRPANRPAKTENVS